MVESTVDTAEPRAVSVLGALDRASLGVVMPREMLLFDNSSLQVAPSTLGLAKLRDAELSLHDLADLRANQLAVSANLRSPALPVLETELARLVAARTCMAPCTVVSIATDGRNPAGLVALARSTGVHIVMGVGLDHKAAAVAIAAAASATASARGHDAGTPAPAEAAGPGA